VRTRWWTVALLTAALGAFLVVLNARHLHPTPIAATAVISEPVPSLTTKPRISGHIFRADGSPAPNVDVQLRAAFALPMDWRTDCKCATAEEDGNCPTPELAGAGVLSSLRERSEPIAHARTDASGAFAFEVVPGQYGVLATHEGEVASASAASGNGLELHLSPAHTLRTRVWSDAYRGFEGAETFVYLRQSRQVLQVPSGKEGHVRLDDLPGETGLVVALAPPHYPGVDDFDPNDAHEGRLWLFLPARLSGGVTFHGAPASAAEVSFRDGRCQRRTSTDRNGRYAWPGVMTTGPVTASAVWNGRRGRRTLNLVPGETADDFDIELLSPGEISGVVVDEDGHPVPAAQVKAEQISDVYSNDPPISVGADAAGRFALRELVPGPFSLSASAGGYRDVTAKTRVEVGEAENEDIRIVLPRESHCAARLVDKDGRPVPNARISAIPSAVPDLPPNHSDEIIGGASSQARADGRFELHGLAPGIYWLSLEGDERSSKLVVPCTGDVSVRAETGPAPDAAAHGWVRSERGLPIAGARLRLEATVDGSRVSVSTEANGEFRVPLAHGKYAVEVRSADEPVSWHLFRDLELAAGDDVLLEFVVSDGGNVAGDVVDFDGAPVSGAWVNVRPLGGDAAKRKSDELETTSDSTGHFEFSHLSPGRLRISASTSELVMTGDAAGVEMQPGRNDLRLVVGRGAKLKGRIVDELGQPIRRFTVMGSQFSSPAGDWETVLQRRGPLQVEIHTSGRPTVAVRAEARPGTTEDLGTIVLPQGVALIGVVVDASTGQPIADALVDPLTPVTDQAVLWFDDPLYATRTRADGSFSLVTLPVGATLRVTAAGYRYGQFAVQAASLRLALRPEPGIDVTSVDSH
jgi:uncharacterized GH25 family protein